MAYFIPSRCCPQLVQLWACEPCGGIAHDWTQEARNRACLKVLDVRTHFLGSY